MHDLMYGESFSSVAMASVWALPTFGFTQTMVWTPFCHSSVALEAPCFISSDEPTSASDTATVRMAATVIRRLRHRLVAASLPT